MKHLSINIVSTLFVASALLPTHSVAEKSEYDLTKRPVQSRYLRQKLGSRSSKPKNAHLIYLDEDKTKKPYTMETRTISTETRKNSSSGGNRGPCDPCKRSKRCWLTVPETNPLADKDGVNLDQYVPIARTDVISGTVPTSHQIYQCVADAKKQNQFNWELRDVEAFLVNVDGQIEGFHWFRSLNASKSESERGMPRWQVGNSLITAANAVPAESPDPGKNIDWLFATALEDDTTVSPNDKANCAPLYDAVRIGRYCTKNGTPDACTAQGLSCDGADDEGRVCYSPYETSYYYFVMKNDTDVMIGWN